MTVLANVWLKPPVGNVPVNLKSFIELIFVNVRTDTKMKFSMATR